MIAGTPYVDLCPADESIESVTIAITGAQRQSGQLVHGDTLTYEPSNLCEVKAPCKLLLTCLTFLVAMTAPASAHGTTASGATNFRTTIQAVTPAVAGISVQVKENGDRLQLVNRTAREVVVLGYSNEPYLKVNQEGVFQNRRSPAVYLNADRYGETNLPGFVDAGAAPDWQKTSSDRVAVWHDHRAHWMSRVLPPSVEGNKSISHAVIPNFSVPLSVNGAPVVITGNVNWIPPKSPWPWFGVVAVVGAVLILLATTKRYALALGLGMTILLLADVTHVVGRFVGGAGPLETRLTEAITTDAASVLAWCTGSWTIVALMKRQDGIAWFVALFSSAVLFIFGGITDSSSLTHSQLVFAWPDSLARLTVAATLGAGASTVGLSGWLIYRNPAVTRFGEHLADDDNASSERNYASSSNE